MPEYECATCGKPHRHLLASILCCDPAAYGEDD